MLSPQGGESPRFAGERGRKKKQDLYKNINIIFCKYPLSCYISIIAY